MDKTLKIFLFIFLPQGWFFLIVLLKNILCYKSVVLISARQFGNVLNVCFLCVWCRNWNISLPDKIEALNGSCVSINCRFDIPELYDLHLTDTAGGVWYKTVNAIKTLVFNSSRPTLSLFKGNITGKLRDKDCTTIFFNSTSNHRGIYNFRIEGKNTLKYVFGQKSVSIDVIESPPNPTVKMFMGQMEVQEVLEGNAVNLRCSAITLCYSSTPTKKKRKTKKKQKKKKNKKQQQQNQTEIISDLNFTASHLQHGVTFICNITYQLQNRNATAQSNITLRVLYAPKNTSVSVFPSDSVLEGASVSLTCRSDANPAVLNYTWFRENGGRLEQLQTGQNLTVNVTDRTHTGRYYCRAGNQHGTQNTSVLLDIQYPPKNTSISSIPSSTVLEGNPVTLICNANANPALVNYTWYRENSGQFQLLQTGYNLTFSITNSKQSGNYYCIAGNKHGQQNTSVLLDIQYASEVSSSKCDKTQQTVCLCEVHGNPSSKVEWFLSGRLITNSTNILIREERLSQTNLKSYVTLLQSPTLNDILQCVSTNTRGTASTKFQLVASPQETTTKIVHRLYPLYILGLFPQKRDLVLKKEMKTSQKIICIILFLKGVWCRDWNISLPEKIEALTGSCVTINCTFDINNTYDLDLNDTAVGIWFKNNHDASGTIMYNSSISNNLGKITGNLKDKDCTTDFYNVSSNHSAKFFFRIEGKGKLRWTYAQKYVSIHVIESPPNPTVKMFMGQMEVQEVLEGNAVNLRCSAITLCCSSSPPTLTWRSTDGLSLNENNRQQQQNQTEIISDLNFTASHLQHGVTFICNITYQLQNRNATAQSNITLRVLYAPKNTSVSVFPSDSVLEGASVSLTCRSDANPAVLNYTWFRENGGRLEQLQTGQNLTVNVTDRTHARYYCRAGNQHGTQNTSVLLDIQCAPKNTSVSVFPSDSVLEGTSVTLTCRSDANPAVLNYTWFRENRGRLEQLQTGQNLTVNVTDRTHTGRYYCRVENQYGTENTSVLLDIQCEYKQFQLFFPACTVV
ncbi:putative B-cell receptor CD22 [Triplophysa rosa]|uniref:B-cell receptor CD22 n=1 Tax=Triplophysa rosa TaxID=992332 RepID=A0A9W7T7I6_TRIRA|nr:putative B-cell receptor CD22 [Triplophysa rosa]